MRQSPDDSLVFADDPTVFPQAGLPLAMRLLAERVQWESVVDALLPWDPVRTQTPPSRLLLALVMNVVSQRTPLYHVERWAATLPLDLLWAPGVQATAFNDDALGRVLEKWAVRGRTVLGTLGIRWQALGQAAPTLLHTDTTSFSLFGDYPGSSPDGEAPHITYGYSKATRSPGRSRKRRGQRLPARGRTSGRSRPGRTRRITARRSTRGSWRRTPFGASWSIRMPSTDGANAPSSGRLARKPRRCGPRRRRWPVQSSPVSPMPRRRMPSP
ncbi:MAG: DUF4277 domain-containing protein [Clostridia bacterium]